MHFQESSGIRAFAKVHCRYRLPYQYQDDTNIRIIAVISFVPVEDVIQAFEELCLHSGDVEQEVFDYFETNYIELRRDRRLAQRVPHEVWNMNTRVRDNLPRSNNDGWHNRFADSFRHHHANIWKFIDGLKGDATSRWCTKSTTATVV